MQTIESINLIATDPKVRNGRPCILGTGIEVSAIAIAKVVHMQSPEEIAADYRLTLAQVYAALSYYYEHRIEIEDSIAKRNQLAEELKEQILAKQTPLLHRRKSES
jgi:uncharacterized protein (DUF433 family)